MLLSLAGICQSYSPGPRKHKSAHFATKSLPRKKELDESTGASSLFKRERQEKQRWLSFAQPSLLFLPLALNQGGEGEKRSAIDVKWDRDLLF